MLFYIHFVPAPLTRWWGDPVLFQHDIPGSCVTQKVHMHSPQFTYLSRLSHVAESVCSVNPMVYATRSIAFLSFITYGSPHVYSSMPMRCELSSCYGHDAYRRIQQCEESLLGATMFRALYFETPKFVRDCIRSVVPMGVFTGLSWRLRLC